MGSLRRSSTFRCDGTRDGLLDASPKVTECQEYSWESRPTRAHGRAVRRGKWHRWSHAQSLGGTRDAERRSRTGHGASDARKRPLESCLRSKDSRAFGEGPLEKYPSGQLAGGLLYARPGLHGGCRVTGIPTVEPFSAILNSILDEEDNCPYA
jgi:hypothetical protein